MRRLLATLLLSLLWVTDAGAQATVRPCVTTGTNSCPPVSATNPMPITGTVTANSDPTGTTSTQVKVTIAVTNTFQTALAASSTRLGCLLQNNGSNAAYVFFGSSTPADLTTSFKLTTGQAISCAVGGVIVATDQIQVTGTANDVLVVSSQ